jgi:hypothetical protein
MASSKRRGVGRRAFLQGAAAGTAGFVAPPFAGKGTVAQGPAGPPPASPAPDEYHMDRSGADFMVDVLKVLDFEYVAANPGSSFRGLHESIINYGGNQKPELLTCCHEESSVAMAHGYAKVEGRPMMVMAHGTVGLQHASMAVYNAYADRVPVYMVIGNILDAQFRRSDVDSHTSPSRRCAPTRLRRRHRAVPWCWSPTRCCRKSRFQRSIAGGYVCRS